MTVLPVYNMIIVPDSHLFIRLDLYQQMTGREPVENEKVTVIVTKEALSRRELQSDSFYPIAATGVIQEISNQGYMTISLSQRVNLDEVYVYNDKNVELTISRRPELQDFDESSAAVRLLAAKEALLEFSKDYQWGPMLRGTLSVCRKKTVSRPALIVWSRCCMKTWSWQKQSLALRALNRRNISVSTGKMPFVNRSVFFRRNWMKCIRKN